MPLLSLPGELILHVTSFIFVPDLYHLSLANKHLRRLLIARIDEDRQLQQRFEKLVYSLPHTSERYRDVDNRGLFAYLLDVLHNPTAAQYVKRIEVDTVRDVARALQATNDEKRQIRNALRHSKWLPRSNEVMLEKIVHGDDDYVLALLMDLVPNIEQIMLPAHCWGGVNLDPAVDMVEAVAKSPRQPSPALPLHNLRHIDASVFNGFYGIGLKGLVRFLALPSVRSVTAECVAEDEFEWPAGLPRSRASLIRFPNSTVASVAIRGFAKGLIGPCWIHHEWGWRRHDSMPQPNNDWTDLRIPFEGASEDEWVIENNNLPQLECGHGMFEDSDDDVQEQEQPDAFEYNANSLTWMRQNPTEPEDEESDEYLGF